MNAKNDRQSIEHAKREALAPWDGKRGLNTIDRNGHAVHVWAGVEETAAELSHGAVRWEKDVLNRPVTPGAENLVVFRLRGHSWTIIVDGVADALHLSQTLKTKVIDFTVSDTCGAISYSLFENGERSEYFYGSEGDGINEFESSLRAVSRRERKDIWGMAHKFFVANDAFDPGLAYEYFFRQTEEKSKPSSLILFDTPSTNNDPRIRNPGIVIVIDGEEVLSKPEFERIDFLVMQESPNKVGRILLA
jgi:hypothetical protein